MRKTFSILLSITMVLSLFGGFATVLAAEATNIPQVTLTDVKDDYAVGDTLSTTVTIPDGVNYTATVEWWKWDYANAEWRNASGTLENAAIYRRYLRVEAEDGYDFSIGEPTLFTINGEERNLDAGAPRIADFIDYFTFGLTAIDKVSLTTADPRLDNPVAQVGDPVTVPSGAPYVLNNSQWYEYDPATGGTDYAFTTFADGKWYYGNFNLVPAAGYYFADEIEFSVDNLNYADAHTPVDAWGEILISLGSIAQAEVLGLPEDVMPYDTASVSGITVPQGAGYTVSAQWTEWDYEAQAYVPFAGKFQMHHDYALKLTITATGEDKFVVSDHVSTYVMAGGWNCWVDPDASSETTLVAYRDYYIMADYDQIYYIQVDGYTKPAVNSGVVTPTLTIPSDADYTITAKWINKDGTDAVGVFTDGNVYYLEIIATAKEGCGFGDYVNFELGYQSEPAEITAYNQVVCRVPVSFLPAANYVELTMDAAADKATEDVTVTIDDDTLFTLESIVWYDDNGEFDGTLEDGKQYDVEMELTLAETHRFGDNFHVIVDGEQCHNYMVQDNTLMLCATVSLLEKITKIEITLPEAVVGEAVTVDNIKVPDDANYTLNSKNWIDYNTMAPATGTFEEGHLYVAFLELIPKDGYEFSGNAQMLINGVAAEEDRHDIGRTSAEYYGIASFLTTLDKVELPAFPTLEEGDALKDITMELPTDAHYTVNLNWSFVDKNGNSYSYDIMDLQNAVVEEDRVYTMSVEVLPEDGYQFDENTEFYVGGQQMSVSGRNFNFLMAYMETFYNFGLTELDKVELTLQVPYAGEGLSDYPVTLPSDALYALDGYEWYVSDTADGTSEEFFRGTFEKGKYYTLNVWVSAKTGYVFTENTVVTVNGKPVDMTQGGNYLRAEWCDVYVTTQADTRPVPEDENNNNNNNESDNDNTGNGGATTNPDTGHTTDVWPFAVVMLLCGGALLVLNRKTLLGK